MNNRGGIGKSTLLFQLVSEYARQHPDVSVAVFDFSIQADASVSFLGGTQEPAEAGDVKARTLGAQRMAALRPEKTGPGIVSAIMEREAKGGGGGGGILGAMANLALGGGGGGSALDLRSLFVQAYENGEGPANIFLASGGVKLHEVLTLQNAERVAGLIVDALAALDGRWVAFFDTDAEVTERPATLAAVIAAERIILPLSANWSDYNRVVDGDPINSLFPVLKHRLTNGLRCAKVDHIVFNSVKQKDSTPCSLHERSNRNATLPFSPVKNVRVQMSQMADHMYQQGWDDMEHNYRVIYMDEQSIADEDAFAARYVQSLYSMPDNIVHISTLTGTPACSMDAKTKYLDGEVKVDAKALDTLQNAMENTVKAWAA